ncbi:MAG: hypothetical protein AABX39_01980, partial [Nanoarchaeota archaeon]
MKNKEKKRTWKRGMILIIVLLLFILQINYASAVGISPAKRTIEYQPGQTERFSYGIWNTEKTESTVKIEAIGGKSRENIVFSETEINFSVGEMMRQIEGAISFPNSTIEQDDFIDVVAKETQKKGAFVNVQLEVKSRIDIKAPPKKIEEVRQKENKKEEVKTETPIQTNISEIKIAPEIKEKRKEINEEEINALLAGALIVLVIMQIYLTIYQVSLTKLSTKEKMKSRKNNENRTHPRPKGQGIYRS